MARKRGGRGGYQKPKRPAAVSGVGKDSARTDGGPGSALPIANNQEYGARKQTEALLSAAPATGQTVPNAGGGGTGPRPDAGSMDSGGLWAPSQRPNEPITAGTVDGAGGHTGHYPDMVLEILYKKWPSPWIAGLMDR